MASVKGQRQRRGVSDHPSLFVRVAPDNFAKLDKMAAALRISKAAIVDAWLNRLELDETGRPDWWTEPVTRDQQELPPTRSA